MFQCLSSMPKNHYKTLNIPATSPRHQIQSGYRRQSLQVHPDRNASPDASRAFEQLTKASRILLDPKRRWNYDHFGDFSAEGSIGPQDVIVILLLSFTKLFEPILFGFVYTSAISDKKSRSCVQQAYFSYFVVCMMLDVLLRLQETVPPSLLPFLNIFCPLTPFEWIHVFYRSISVVLTLLITLLGRSGLGSDAVLTSDGDGFFLSSNDAISYQIIHGAAEALFSSYEETVSRLQKLLSHHQSKLRSLDGQNGHQQTSFVGNADCSTSNTTQAVKAFDEVVQKYVLRGATEPYSGMRELITPSVFTTKTDNTATTEQFLAQIKQEVVFYNKPKHWITRLVTPTNSLFLLLFFLQYLR